MKINTVVVDPKIIGQEWEGYDEDESEDSDDDYDYDFNFNNE